MELFPNMFKWLRKRNIKLRAAPEKKQGGGMAGVLFWLDRALKGIN